LGDEWECRNVERLARCSAINLRTSPADDNTGKNRIKIPFACLILSIFLYRILKKSGNDGNATEVEITDYH
jgi:hypothetical protein